MPARPSKSKSKAAPKKVTKKSTIDLVKLSFRGPDPKPGPLWEGPDGNGPNGGVTFSLLSRWLTCRERFRIMTVEGLRAPEQFVAPIEFGNMWHICEEAHASPSVNWGVPLQSYTSQLMQRFPFQRDEVQHWYEKCAALFPAYAEYWRAHPDVEARTPLLSEQAFDVPYRLPSGRTVRMRGKWDSVDLVGGGVWLQENKTKSQIDQTKINRQLRFDLQTMLYLIALQEPKERWTRTDQLITKYQLKGVRYNVVRRSAHKTAESMMKKVNEDVADGRGAEWFARWNVEVGPADVDRFRRTCLDPMLETVCSWWNYVTDSCNRPFEFGRSGDVVGHGVHWVHPFGVRNIIDEGGSTDLDECVLTGSTVGLRRAETLFPELQT